MDEFIQNAREGKYTEALAWMKLDKNKVALLEVIHKDLLEDDDDEAFWDYVGIYDLAMDTATEEAAEFATLLKAFIIKAGVPADNHLFTGYELRQGKLKTNQYYKYLAETNYLRANEFIRIPGNREAVVSVLNNEFEEAGLDIKWQTLYDDILDNRANDTAGLLQGIITDATKGAIILDPHSYAKRRAARIAARMEENAKMQEAIDAADAAAGAAGAAGSNNNGSESEMTLPPPPNNNMGGGHRKSRRRARKNTRRVRKSTRRSGKKYAKK